jgi:hypothetical protein
LNVTTDSAVSSKSVPHEYFYQTELLDRTLFWTTADLEAKLIDFQHYYNGRPELMPGWTEDCQSPTGLELPWILLPIDGKNTAGACTKPQSLHDLGIRHGHARKRTHFHLKRTRRHAAS